MSVSVRFCPFLSVSVCFCPYLSVSVSFCQFLSVSVHLCPFLSIAVWFCQFMSNSLNFCHFCPFRTFFVVSVILSLCVENFCVSFMLHFFCPFLLFLSVYDFLVSVLLCACVAKFSVSCMRVVFCPCYQPLSKNSNQDQLFVSKIYQENPMSTKINQNQPRPSYFDC